MRNRLTLGKTGLWTALLAAAIGPGLPALAEPAVPPASIAAPAAPSLLQTIGAFRPTPKQTIAIRDFLGSRMDKPVLLGVQPNGLTLFELRDAQNTLTGQIAVGLDPSEGTIFVSRVTGPASFDMSRRAALPRVVNSKMHAAVSALLAGAEAGPRYEAITARGRDLFLRDRPMLAIAPGQVSTPDRIIAAEASFFSDGSGFVRSLRAPVGTTAVAPLRVSVKYYPAIDADGKKAFRDAVLGVDADFSATLADLGNKVSCPTAGCAASQPASPIKLIGEAHLTRWPHAIVPTAPANLIALISAPPALPDILNDSYPPQTQPPAGPSIDASGLPHDPMN